MIDEMQPVFFLEEEGGYWIPRRIADMGREYLAVKFRNGAIWDRATGWRKHIKIRVKMGRAFV